MMDHTTWGARDIEADPLDKTQQALRQSPTGLQLSIDGSFVLATYSTDPTMSILSPPDGKTVLWEDPVTGDRFISTFLRATGWKSVQVTP